MKKSRKYKKFKKLLTSKTLMGALLFALSLWGYTTLSGDFLTFVDVPLSIELPDNRAIEDTIPSTIAVQVSGTGWHLFTLIFFNSSARCHIDLSGINIMDSTYTITRSDFIKSVEYFLNVKTIDVVPETMTLKTGLIGTYRIPVKPNVRISTRDGFVKVGNITVTPDSITVKGNNKKMKSICEWETQYVEFEDTHKPFSAMVSLKDTLSNVINKSESLIKITVDIQQIAEVTLNDVRVIVRGGKAPKNHRLLPEFLNVTLRGGIYQISDLDPKSVSASISYYKIIKDSTGIIEPVVIVPSGLELLKVEPQFLYHYIELPNIKLTGF